MMGYTPNSAGVRLEGGLLMQLKDIIKMIDHTIIKQDACWDEVRQVIDEGIRHQAASVCIPPSYLTVAKAYAGDAIPIAVVNAFPFGYQTTAAKVFEIREAIESGADEVDMLINIGWLRDKDDRAVTDELSQIKNIVGDKILKVIIEACLLTDEEKIRACKIITEAGADYIKTSTGLAAGGATPHDIMLFAANIGAGVKIKASGGIRTIEDAEKFIALGASRIGSSQIIRALDIARNQHE